MVLASKLRDELKSSSGRESAEGKAGAMQAVADIVLPLDDSGVDKGKTDGL